MNALQLEISWPSCPIYNISPVYLAELSHKRRKSHTHTHTHKHTAVVLFFLSFSDAYQLNINTSASAAPPSAASDSGTVRLPWFAVLALTERDAETDKTALGDDDDGDAEAGPALDDDNDGDAEAGTALDDVDDGDAETSGTFGTGVGLDGVGTGGGVGSGVGLGGIG
jgi:hypothetical protein